MKRVHELAVRISGKKTYSDLIFLVLASVMAFHFNQLRFGMTGQPLENNIYQLMEGSAHTPFQYRVLIPWTVNLVLQALKLLPGVPPISPESIFQYIELIAMFLLLVALHNYAALFFENHAVVMLSSFIAFPAMLFHFVLPRPSPLWYVHWFPFDIPAVLFVTVGLTLLYRKKWLLFYPLLLIATVNRETSIFLVLAYLVTSIGREKFKTVFYHVFLQLALVAVVKYMLFEIYVSNPVGDAGLDPLEIYHAQDVQGLFDRLHRFLHGDLSAASDIGVNIRAFMKPSAYPFIFSVLGYLWIPVALLVSTVRHDFVTKTLVVAACWWSAGMYFGTVYQLRVFGELLPMVGTAFVLIIGELLKKEIAYNTHTVGS